jgi:cysteinyl-tRNA synthetase
MVKRKIIPVFFIALCGMLAACISSPRAADLNYRQEMRNFIQHISAYARNQDPDFIVIPQNGQELLVQGQDVHSAIDLTYIDSIAGIGREDLFYGYSGDDCPTDPTITAAWVDHLILAQQQGLSVLVIDYCSSPQYVEDAQQHSQELGFLPYVADQRELDDISPAPLLNENSADIISLSQAKNFLYLINPSAFPSKTEFIRAVTATNYDLLVMDLYFNDDAFTRAEIEQLRRKANGGSRLVLCYMSIGEAEDYRPYWQPEWRNNPPEWLLEENPNWAGNYKVRYWDEEWQALITGSADSYLANILDVGFDGVYLDLVDAFQRFEN